jgi:hypothetical protein
MTDPNTFTAEHRSWQWEVMLKFEDGTLPPSDWNEATLGVVADWYAKNLPREQAIARYEASYHRNHRRLSNRLGAATVQTEAIEAVNKVWQSLLSMRLDALKK